MLAGTVEAQPLALKKKRKTKEPDFLAEARKRYDAPKEPERRTKAAAALHYMLANPAIKSLQRVFENDEERRNEERELKYLIGSMGIERTVALGVLPEAGDAGAVVIQRIQ